MDRRRFTVTADHAQTRVSRPGIPFAAKGFDFLEGELSNAWVNPVTGRLQPIPNSERPEFQTSSSGDYLKLGLSDYDLVDYNASPPADVWAEANPIAEMRGIHYTGDNTEGVGGVTVASYDADQGMTAFVYSHSSGVEQSGILLEFGWDPAAPPLFGAEGVSVRVYHDGRIEIYKEGVMQARGSFSGGGYGRATNEYVMIRAEAVSGRYLLLTSSKSGVFQYAVPWADPSLDSPGPIIPAGKWWFYVPKGSASIIAAPVLYPATSYAVSPLYNLSEAPGTVDGLHKRCIPNDGFATLTLKAANGTGAYDPDSREVRFRVDMTPGAWVDGLAGLFPPETVEMEPDYLDVTSYAIDRHYSLDDGPGGLSVRLVFQGDAPIPDLKEREGRPYLVELTNFEEEGPPTIAFLDGIAGPPTWQDGYSEAHERVTVEIRDRLSLLEDAQVRTAFPLDGLPLCRPVADGESAVLFAAREAGFPDSVIVLPDLGYTIPETPPQRAGDWNMAAEVGDTWADVLSRLMDLASHCVYGCRPGLDGPEFYVLEPSDDDEPVLTLYRSPEQAATDGFAVPINELSVWPWLYGDHNADRLPREANVVRVTGFDPAAEKGLQAYISDDASRDPSEPYAEGHLGLTREFAYTDPALTTQDAVNRLAENVWRAVARKKDLESWSSFLIVKEDGVPAWRGEKVRLKGGARDGGDSEPRISGFQFSPVDESGEGFMEKPDDLEPYASAHPIPVRIVGYVGGSIVGLGGSDPKEIKRRLGREIKDGGLRRRGWKRIPSVSPLAVVEVAIP